MLSSVKDSRFIVFAFSTTAPWTETFIHSRGDIINRGLILLLVYHKAHRQIVLIITLQVAEEAATPSQWAGLHHTKGQDLLREVSEKQYNVSRTWKIVRPTILPPRKFWKRHKPKTDFNKEKRRSSLDRYWNPSLRNLERIFNNWHWGWGAYIYV